MKRTLKRELKVLEIVEGEANGSRGAPRFYVGVRAPAYQREALVSVG